jgi:hypothetical protein
MMTLNLRTAAPYVTVSDWELDDYSPSGTIPSGSEVQYVAHVYGGMVKVEWGEKIVVIHPGCTVELS